MVPHFCSNRGSLLYITSSPSSVVMRKCWREDPEERPTFSQLSSIVERLLASISGYTELGMVLVDTSQEEELSKCINYMDLAMQLLFCLPYAIIIVCIQ